jgi:hypothetical protein
MKLLKIQAGRSFSEAQASLQRRGGASDFLHEFAASRLDFFP